MLLNLVLLFIIILNIEIYSDSIIIKYKRALRNIRQYRTKIVRVLRSQIFRQIVQRGRRKAVALLGRIVQDDEKYASKTRAKSNKWSLCGVAIILQG